MEDREGGFITKSHFFQKSGQEGGLAKLFTPYYDNNAAQFMIECKVSSTRIVPSHLEGRHWEMLV